MNHAMSLLLPAVLIGFGVYRRIRRTVGYQKLEPRRLIVRSVLFTVLGLMIVTLAVRHPIQLVGDAVGLIGGLTLAYYGIRHLKFEKREQGWFYRTHGIVEAIVLALFIGRVVYRIVELALIAPGATGPAPGAGGAGANPYGDISRDPLTSAVFFVLVSYYVRFFTYLLRKAKRLDAAGDADGSPPA
jgi:hypothetical protein